MPDNGAVKRSLEYHEFAHLLPHASSWMLIDRVVDWTPSTSIVTRKCMTGSDWFVASHFADGPRIVPGVMLIELVGQSAHLLSRLSGDGKGDATGRMQLLARCRAQFLRPVLAGEVAEAYVRTTGAARGIVFYKGLVRVNGSEVCQVELVGSAVDMRPGTLNAAVA